MARPGPPPGGYASEQDRHAGSGVPPTLEDATGRPGRGRLLALAGAAGVLVVALVTALAVAALRSSDDPDTRDPAALTGAPATAEPGLPGPQPSAGTPEPAPSRTGRTGRSPSAAPGRPAAGATTPGGDAAPTGAGSPQPASPTSAPQRPNPYPPGQVCGSGYRVIDSATLSANGVRRGRVYLLYNATTGVNCVVTLKDTDVGRASPVSAYLEVQGKTRQTDSGSFQYYAGPVRAGAAGACVKWGGSVGGAGYGSPFEHCG